MRFGKALITAVLAAAVVVGTAPPPAGAATACQRTVFLPPQVSAGEGAGELRFLVHSQGCAAAGSVGYSVEAGTATRPADFTATTGRLAWRAGETGSLAIVVALAPDPVREPDIEDLTVRLAEPSPQVRVAGATGQGRILDDDGTGPTFTLDNNWCGPPDYPGCSCDVGFDNVYCPPGLHPNFPMAAPVTVHWSTSDGTAVAGVDFVGVTDQLVTAPAGATGVDLPIRFLPRPAGTPSRWFSVVIARPSAGRIVDAVAEVTIGAG